MKEIIVIKKHELYTLLDCLPMPMITDEDLEKEIKEGRKLILFGKERKVEQVPETYEELKELVNKYSGKINRQVGGITVGTTRIIIMMKFDNIYFGKNGNIYFADKFLGTYTPARQWEIIKSLIGEE